MPDTRHDVDIDLTVVPAQRTSVEDKLEIIHHAPAVADAVPIRDNRLRIGMSEWLIGICASLVVGGSVGVVVGAVVSARDTTPATSVPARNGDLTGLLMDPLSSQPPQPAAPTDQQDLITTILTPNVSP